MRLVDEEPFTPIVAVMPYDVLDDAIAEANRPDYGLVGYVCGRTFAGPPTSRMRSSAARSSSTAGASSCPTRRMRAGAGSGVGCELGRPGLEAFIRWQHVRVLA